MPECPKCHQYFFGNPDKCPKCDYVLEVKRNPAIRYEPTQANSASHQTNYNISNTSSPDVKTCYHAESLDKWGKNYLIACVIIATISFIAGGFQSSLDRYGDVITKFSFGAMFSVGSIINVLLWLGGGFAFKLVLNSFAVIVEASYRSMKKE